MKKYYRFDILQQVKKGYSIKLNSDPIDYKLTYLNIDNIANVKRNTSSRTIEIETKTTPRFYSIAEIRKSNNVPSKIKYITIDGLIIDSVEVFNIKLEIEAIKNIRFLTQSDYERPEYDNLSLVKDAVGDGILIITTNEF